MRQLEKVNSKLFNKIYEGTAVSGWKVTCILDDNCVRYTVVDRFGRSKSRREYDNHKKELCFKRATEALNRI